MRESYDDVPYLGGSYYESHPAHIAAMARLLGLTPPPVAGARVLEVGSARGRNVVPMAAWWPQTRFVAIDAAPRQVDDARALAAAAGLDNLELRCGDLREVDDGPYDYIIAHGVYSWVAPDVRDALVAMLSRQLAPDGVAFLSYNAYPGWLLQRPIADLMAFHAEAYDDASEGLAAARQLIDFASSNALGDELYAALLQREAKRVMEYDDWYLHHDQLSRHNDPAYVRDVADHLGRHGLIWVGEADFGVRTWSGVAATLREALRSISDDRVRVAQYLDFLTNRAFRRSIVARAGVEPLAAPDAERVRGLDVAARVAPASGGEVDLTSTDMVVYKSVWDHKFGLTSPLLKAAFAVLADAWPNAVPFEGLLDAASARAGTGDAVELAEALLHGFDHGSVRLTLGSARCGRAGADARLHPALVASIEAGDDSITNAHHLRCTVSDFDLRLIRHLDGRPRAAVVDALIEDAAAGLLTVHVDGAEVSDAEALRAPLYAAIDNRLDELEKLAVLAPSG